MPLTTAHADHADSSRLFDAILEPQRNSIRVVPSCLCNPITRSSAINQGSRGGEDGTEHLWRQPARVRVLTARVIRRDHREAARNRDDLAMNKDWPRLRQSKAA